MATRKTKAKLLFTLEAPVKARVVRAAFEPFAITHYLSASALKKAPEVRVDIGSLDIGGRCVTLQATLRHGVIDEITPAACAGCGPAAGGRKPGRRATQALLKAVTAELGKRRIGMPPWPAGGTYQAARGFRIPIGPIVIIIGTDPDEGIDTFDCCVIITIGTKTCTYCLGRPSACLDLPGPL